MDHEKLQSCGKYADANRLSCCNSLHMIKYHFLPLKFDQLEELKKSIMILNEKQWQII